MLLWETIKGWILEKKKLIIVGSFVGFAIGVYIIHNQLSDSVQQVSVDENPFLFMDEEVIEDQEKKEASVIEEDKKMMVDVKGAVNKLGVYKVEEGERIIDVIQRAGGFTDEADVDQINLSERVTDEMVIYVPKIGEEKKTPLVIGGGGKKQDQININDADEQLLQTLPGIGPSKAQAIVQYRKENGPFKEIEELMNISGIGEKTFEKIKDSITVR
ncbi:helix-hairpin-helix domain-containing protein [Fervidibacillus halotolerans]|uniref:Helix-hairpin-helix domain-containing protein n=1 Tax=Fervidibacillus halotolerans TaxID=2980027 RepID=A0A9E8RXA5_9BACI|nr:helix-hairpin-helix domain-containing protein [Fervidibacillus halotolerans]WAA11521.1 helix-hairpin-helix domain-containing protein [Fervidibacillus halotolerans]